MKRPYVILLSLLAGTSLLTSCGEDRTHEYEELTAGTHWIETAMRQYYLWNDSISSLGWKDYFAEPSEFLSRIMPSELPYGQTDAWSYCIESDDDADPHQRGHSIISPVMVLILYCSPIRQEALIALMHV